MMRAMATVDAAELVTRIVDHAGGADRWEQLAALELRVRVKGLAFRLMGQVDAVADMDQLVQVHEPRVEVSSRSVPGWRGTFDAGSASMLSEDGTVRDHREPAIAYRSLPWPKRPWDDVETLTFCAYASWNYVTFPVMLRRADVRADAIGEHTIGGERLHGLKLTFGPGVPTHSPDQVFWVTEEGRLRRHDYVARMVSPLAKAANRCLSERSAFGVTLPDHRLVTPLLPGRRAAPGPVIVDVEMELTGGRER